MSNIKLVHSGGNSVSLTTPDSNPAANRTFKLPGADGSSGQALVTDGNGALSFGTPAGAGKILQVKQTVLTTHQSRAGGGATVRYNITGFNVSITPSSASNKILVRYVANVSQSSADGNGVLRLIKDASTISGFNGSDGTVANGSNFIRLNSHWELGSFSGEYLDDAGTTNAITYQLQWSMESGRTIYLNRRGGSAEYGAVSTITAMEVAV